MRIRLIQEKTCKRPTLMGWLVLCIVTAGLLRFTMLHIGPFLSLNQPVQADILVVEGHVPDYALDSTLVLYKSASYVWVLTTGIPIVHSAYFAGFDNYADLTAAMLRMKGLDSTRIISVPCRPAQKDRTFASALALKAQLQRMGKNKGALNVLSCGSHARRTHLLFQRALGPGWQVGIFSIPDQDYDTRRWWRSSYGMRSVVYEGLAFIYAVLFGPGEQGFR